MNLNELFKGGSQKWIIHAYTILSFELRSFPDANMKHEVRLLLPEQVQRNDCKR